jgi:hypothetical protein
MATGTNGELLRRFGEGKPYEGRIGVEREGALADLLLVGGDPVADIGLITGPAAVGKSTLAGQPQRARQRLTQRLVEQSR